MGTCQSSDVKLQTILSKNIDRQIYAAPSRLSQKLLLLGPGESGKSTILKQMQILHNNGFTEIEIEERRSVVFSNTLQSIKAMLDAMDQLKLSFDNSDRKADAQLIQKLIADGHELLPFTADVKVALKRLWSDKGVNQCYEQRSKYQLNDSAKYFLDAIDRISAKDYRPTVQDILHTRVATTGVIEVKYIVKNIEFRVFDVGGQRSERRKWIHCFDDVNGIIFIVAISEYDQVIREDNRSNRLIEGLELFDNICNSPYFSHSSMILFLNKKDLFADKVRAISLKIAFPSYNGDMSYTSGVAFIRQQFAKLNRDKRKIYMHETCATDTDQVTVVINSVIDTIVQENLKDTGMM